MYNLMNTKAKLISTLYRYNLELHRKTVSSESAKIRRCFVMLYSKKADIIKRKKKILRDKREALGEMIKRNVTEDEVRNLEQSWDKLWKKADNDWKYWEKMKVRLERTTSNWEKNCKKIERLIPLLQDNEVYKESLLIAFLLAFSLTYVKPKPILKLIVGIWILKRLHRFDYTNPDLLDNLPDIFDLF